MFAALNIQYEKSSGEKEGAFFEMHITFLAVTKMFALFRGDVAENTGAGEDE